MGQQLKDLHHQVNHVSLADSNQQKTMAITCFKGSAERKASGSKLLTTVLSRRR